MQVESHHTFASGARGEWHLPPVVLTDVTKSGRERPWQTTKAMNEAAQDAYRALGGDYARFADRLANCGQKLHFECQEVGGEVRKRLQSARFCRCRSCMLCQWRRSLVMQEQLEQVIKEHLRDRPTDVPLFLTLTIANMEPEKLPDALGEMLEGFDRFRRYRAVSKAVNAWCKRVEFTRNAETGQMHPHIHALLMVPKEYFRKYKRVVNSRGEERKDPRELYLNVQELAALWQKAMRLDYSPSVSLRRVGEKGLTDQQLREAVNETAKYMIKPVGIYAQNHDGTYSIDPVVLKSLHDATENRRLVGWGGHFAEVRRKLNLEDVESDTVELILRKGEELTEDGFVVSEDGEVLEVGPKWTEAYTRKRVQSNGPPQYIRSYTDRNRMNAQAGERAAPDRREGRGGPPLASVTQSEHRYRTA